MNASGCSVCIVKWMQKRTMNFVTSTLIRRRLSLKQYVHLLIRYFTLILLSIKGCNQNNASACYSLGEWYQLIVKDTKKAAALYDSNCTDRKHANSCFNLGLLYFSGKLKTEDEPKEAAAVEAFKAFDRACQFGNSQACGHFASLKLRGLGCKKDVGGALGFLEGACKENDVQSCLKLATVLLQPEVYSIKRDPVRAHPAAQRGCDLGHPNCCQILAVMYKNGDGVEKDTEKFEAYKERTLDIIKQTGERLGVTVL